MITLIQYAGQNVTPENDASVYNALARGANSCLTEIEANINEQGKIAFTDGYMLIQGRVVHLESHTITPVLPESGTATGTIYIEIDITNTDAPCQIKTTLDAFVPVQGDINLGGSLYQLKIGTYSATTVQAVSGSINMQLPNSADTTFELGYKDDKTGRIKMYGTPDGASIKIYRTNDGKEHAILESLSYGSSLKLKDNNGIIRAYLVAQPSGGALFLYKEDGFSLDASLGNGNLYLTGEIVCNGDLKTNKDLHVYGNAKINKIMTSDANGLIFVAGKSIGNIPVGQTFARVSYDSDGGRLILYNKNGDERIRMGIKGNGAGKIEIIDENGNAHNVLTD